MTPEILVDIHRAALDELRRYSQQASSLQMELASIESYITKWKAIRDATKDAVCPACSGYGRLRVYHDQDDCKLEACRDCCGTGTKVRR